MLAKAARPSTNRPVEALRFAELPEPQILLPILFAMEEVLTRIDAPRMSVFRQRPVELRLEEERDKRREFGLLVRDLRLAADAAR
jgi:hypothetical protein